jgi:hypothetical protein
VKQTPKEWKGSENIHPPAKNSNPQIISFLAGDNDLRAGGK